MGFTVSTPRYMYQSPSGYIFRLPIPADLKDVVGKTEFRYSLRSGILRVAMQRARSIAAFIQQLLTKILSCMEDFTSEQITDLVRNYIVETLANDEKCRSLAEPTATGNVTLEGKTMLEASNMKSDEVQSLLTSVNRWLRHHDHSLMHPVAQKILDREGAKYDPESDTFKTLSRALLKLSRNRLKR